jgi:serine/threonine-protein kinase HipA
MHLKNFSLLKNENKEYNLCPAYDLVASELVVEGDDEELALNLNGKKKNLKKEDFELAMATSGINDKAVQNIFSKFGKMSAHWCKQLDSSFLSQEMKKKYKEMIQMKFENIYT